MRPGTTLLLTALLLPHVASAEQGPEAGSAPASPGDPRLEQAGKAARDGRPDDALGLIREAAKDHPEWPTPRLVLARILFQADQAPAARRALEQAAAEAPDDPSVYLTFASIALGDGRFSDARLNAERALVASSNRKLADQPARVVSREARGVLATVAEAREDWSTARDQLAARLDAEPNDGQARERLARALFQLGKAEDAFRELQKARGDVPALDPPGVTMARLWARKGDDATASKWFDYALKAEPKEPGPRLAYARWLLDRDKLDEARAQADEAARLAPGSPEVDRMLGLIAWSGRDFAAAERALEALHKRSPADLAVADLLARALIEQDDPEKKARALQLALADARQAPRSTEILATLGRAHHRLGHLDEAEKILRSAASGGQVSPDTAYFLACLLLDRGRKDEAKSLLVKATARTGTFAYRAEAERSLAAP